MQPGLHIKDTQIIFTEYLKEEIGSTKYCGSFRLNINDGRLIALSPRLLVDDETLFVLIVDESDNIYPMPDNILKGDGVMQLEKHFSLPRLTTEWEKFAYNDHHDQINKVVYPTRFYGMDLFQKDMTYRFTSRFTLNLRGKINQELRN